MPRQGGSIGSAPAERGGRSGLGAPPPKNGPRVEKKKKKDPASIAVAIKRRGEKEAHGGVESS